jgi:hypothetical protein
MQKLIFTGAAVLTLGLFSVAARGEDSALLPGFQRAAEFDEQERWSRLESGVRIYVNAPRVMKSSLRRLVIYATPNGNTIEQTLGCAMAEERDWHFDIQHVAAQIRRLRELSPDEDIVLAVVQAPKLSWPAFRQAETNHKVIIRGLVDDLAKQTAAERVVLSGHSGGGSFMFGYLNAFETIPATVERIVFLDANYAYSDEEHHGDKLLAWLRGDSTRRLIVIAYDDREITLNGKRVVGPTGGTYRASGRMIDRLTKDVPLPAEKQGPFDHQRGMDGQIEFFIHPNPDNKILHTALVGEMNGLLHGLTLGTPRVEAWGKFGGPRAYTSWIQTEPFKEVEDSPPESCEDDDPPTLTLPPRRVDAISGSAFFHQIESLSRDDREAATLQQITQGNIPGFLRFLKHVYIKATDSQGTMHTATCYVTPDYLAIGSDTDFFRIPMTPQTAQMIASTANASLITTKLSDDIFKASKIKLEPKPLTKDRESAATFYQHHKIIEEQRLGRELGLLIAGIKKDVVLTNRLKEKPNRVAIYGWHQTEIGKSRLVTPQMLNTPPKPIQPLYVGHVDWYVDYSHGIRLMSKVMDVDGRVRRVEDVLKDKELSVLLSNEGPIEIGY